MRVFLDAVYVLLALLAAPYILLRMATSRRWRAGLAQRLGFVPLRPAKNRRIWIHAVSVGEVGVARPFVSLIEKECPGWEVCISTTTNTGQKIAKERFGAERCFYFPLDLSSVVRRAFRRVRPDVVVLIELELWPNFLRETSDCCIPVLVVNGRMREEQVGCYRLLKPLFKNAFDPAGRNLFCVQNETYRGRFVRAGVPESLLRITGNMKYDALATEVDADRLAEMNLVFGVTSQQRVWIAGCTWPGEEEICLNAHRRLRQRFPDLRLIIAPRHVERADEVARCIVRAGFACRRRSGPDGMTGPDTVGLLDSTGELIYVYKLAGVAFVGKSLTACGGHNILEPAALGTVPLFGPFTDNFADEARVLLEAEAAECVADENTLVAAIQRLLDDTELRRDRADRGRKVVLEYRGASRRNLESIRRLLESRKASGE